MHEIKTPLTACSLILANGGDETKLRRELKRADNLTETILYYARLKSSDRVTVVGEAHAAQIVGAVYALYFAAPYLSSKKASSKTKRRDLPVSEISEPGDFLEGNRRFGQKGNISGRRVKEAKKRNISAIGFLERNDKK